nr:hypothetical protein [Tanacetum cinerariifolium]
MLWGNPPMKTFVSFSLFGTMFGHKVSNSWNDTVTDSPFREVLDDQRTLDDTWVNWTRSVVLDDDKTIDYETLDVKSLIVECESQVLGTNKAGDLHVYKLTRLDGSYRHFSTFSRMLEYLDRQDVLDLHKIIMERFPANDPEDWKLLSWKLYETCGVHTLMLDDSLVSITMFAEKRLKKSKVFGYILLVIMKLILNKLDFNLVKIKFRGGLLGFMLFGVSTIRRPQPRSNTKNHRVHSASKSSCIKNKEFEVEEHHRNLLLSKNKKHMSSECNNIKPAIWNAKTKVIYAMCKQCLITANHDACMLKYVNDMNSGGKKKKPEVKKPKKVGSKERLASPTPSEPSITRMWSPTGRMFDCNGKIIKSKASKGQSNGDNECTSNS